MQHFYKTRTFTRWQRKTSLPEEALLAAITQMQAGLIDADLGGQVYKKRVAIAGQGKSGGARTLIATNRGDRWIFLFGFEKNDRANISPSELYILQGLGRSFLRSTEKELGDYVADGTLVLIRGKE